MVSLPLPLKWALLLLFNGQWNSHQPVLSLLLVSSNPPLHSRSTGSHWACPEHFVSLLQSLSLTPYMPPLTPSVSNCTAHSFLLAYLLPCSPNWECAPAVSAPNCLSIITTDALIQTLQLWSRCLNEQWSPGWCRHPTSLTGLYTVLAC